MPTPRLGLQKLRICSMNAALNKKTRIFQTVATAILLIAVAGCSGHTRPSGQPAAVAGPTTNVTAKLPQGTNVFPIMPWNSPPNDPAVLKKIRDCGFTLAGFVPPSALDACEAAGLKAIVSDRRVGGYEWAAVDESAARSNVLNLI